MQFLVGKTAQDNAILVQYASERFAARVAAEKAAIASGKPTHRKDFMHYLLNSHDPKTGWKPSETELKSDSLLLIGAGADTIATTVSAILFYLLRNPATLERAKAEVRANFASLEEIKNGPNMERCVYLQAVVEETLRLASPVQASLPREAMAGGVLIDGVHVPAGTVVGASAYTLHHDAGVFAKPWVFAPERWIVDEEKGVTAESVRRQVLAMSPFSHGSRGCIGKALAYIELRDITAHILFLYDVREVEGKKVGGGGEGLELGREKVDEYQIFDCFAADREGPVVQFKRREGLPV